jgi:hypothetical protein
MGGKCTVCRHPEVNAINGALFHGTKTWKELGKEYAFSHATIGRHKAHILRAATVIKAPNSHTLAATQQAVGMLVQGQDLMSEIRALKRKADALGAQAESSHDVRTALLAIRELTRLIELQGRLTLEVNAGRASDVANHPVFHELSALIYTALDPYPEARKAVIAAISARLNLPIPVDVVVTAS